MTTSLLETPRLTDDVLAEAAGDAALVAVLRAKPDDEQIPTAVWWLVAEALRTSVALRRAVTTGVGHDEDTVALRAEAALLTGAALEELADATGVHPTPVLVSPGQPAGQRAAVAGSILALARLLVSHRITSPQRLVAALADHHRAIRTTT